MSRDLTFEELLKYQNPKSRSIKSIKFFNRPMFPKNEVYTMLLRGGYISIKLRGDADVIDRTNEFVNEWVEGIRPWYWRFVRVTRWGTIIGWLLPIIFTYSLIYLAYDLLTRYDFYENLRGVHLWLVLMSVAVTTGSFANFLHEKVFPNSEFLIGQNIKRYKAKDTFRWTVVIGFFVSIASALFLLLL